MGRLGGRRERWGVARRPLAAAAVAALVGGCAARTAEPPPPVVVRPAGAVPEGAAAAAGPADSTRAPLRGGDGDRRFLIVAVGDSTVSLLAAGERWLRSGTYGIAVDPRRRDALVARLYVQTRVADTAVALVTGQTTRLSTDYVAIFRQPSTPVLRQGGFWGGLASGFALGALVALVIVRGP